MNENMLVATIDVIKGKETLCAVLLDKPKVVSYCTPNLFD